ncbi:MAG: hypothetical protein ACXW32_05940, partial [Limisphaerales bacterium]
MSPAWAEDGLPVFTRQPSCEETGNTNLLRLRAVVSGAESLQWMSNDVPVVGGTNLTIEFAPDLKNVTAYVLIASNSAGVVPSQLMWAHACEAYAFDGVVQLDSTEQLVLDRNGVPTADGWVKLYVARIAEELGPWGHWRIPIPALQVKDGRIANVPRPVLYRPGTRVYAQFRKVDFPGADEEHGFSKIFEATVGTTSEPGSLDAVEPWEFRSIFCYGLKHISFPT